MEPNNNTHDQEIKEAQEVKPENAMPAMKMNNQSQIAGAIIRAGLIIAGAVLLKSNSAPAPAQTSNPIVAITLAPISAADRVLGSPDAKLKLVMYEDFQCPFCGKFVADAEQMVKSTYVANNQVEFVYRDYAFLGAESVSSAEAARCAEDQGQFWQYHDYLFAHQAGENQGGFSNSKLEGFAKTLGLNTTTFNQCLASGQHTKDVTDSTNEGKTAGVQGTPKGFIITQKDISTSTQTAIIKSLNLPAGIPAPVSFYTDKKIMSMDGALPSVMVKGIIDILLKQ